MIWAALKKEKYKGPLIILNPFDPESIQLVETVFHSSHRPIFIPNYNSLRNSSSWATFRPLMPLAPGLCSTHI